MLTVWVLDEAGLRRIETADACKELVGKPNTMVWIDAEGHSPEAEHLLTDVLKLHPLTVEDIFRDRPTPKIEDYGDYLYLTLHGVQGDARVLSPVELDVVLAKDWLFTHHPNPIVCVSDVADRLARNPKQLQRGPAWVAHAL